MLFRAPFRAEDLDSDYRHSAPVIWQKGASLLAIILRYRRFCSRMLPILCNVVKHFDGLSNVLVLLIKLSGWEFNCSSFLKKG